MKYILGEQRASENSTCFELLNIVDEDQVRYPICDPSVIDIQDRVKYFVST